MSLVKQKIGARFFAPLLALGLIFQLAGCNDNEPQQRKAYIEFLQTRVVEGNKINLPELTAEQKKAFGDTNEDSYSLLRNFNEKLNDAFSKSMETSMNDLKALNSMQAMVDNRDKIEKAQQETQDAQAKVSDLKKETGEKYANLKLPEEVKTVYDKAYDKIVTQQGDLANQTLVLLNSTFNDILSISDFLKSQGDNVEYRGQVVQFSEQEALDRFNEMNASLQKNQQELMNVARKIAQMM